LSGFFFKFNCIARAIHLVQQSSEPGQTLDYLIAVRNICWNPKRLVQLLREPRREGFRSGVVGVVAHALRPRFNLLRLDGSPFKRRSAAYSVSEFAT
jgi:hypothetical protein